MGATPRATGTRVYHLDVIAARDRRGSSACRWDDGTAVVVEGGLTAPADGLGPVWRLVLALCGAVDVALIELVGSTAGWEVGQAHVCLGLCLCLAGTASAEGFWVCWEDGRVLSTS